MFSELGATEFAVRFLALEAIVPAGQDSVSEGPPSPFTTPAGSQTTIRRGPAGVLGAHRSMSRLNPGRA